MTEPVAYLTRADIAARFRKDRGWTYRKAARAFLARIGFPPPIVPGLWHPDHVAAWEAARWPAELPRPAAPDSAAADQGRAFGSPLSEAELEASIASFFHGPRAVAAE